MSISTVLGKYLSKATAMDASWEESKHHRADNGRFTSGSGRGRAGGAGEKVKRNGEGEGRGSGGREEMTEDRAEKVIRSAFKDAKQELKGLKLVNRAMNAEVLEADEGSCEKVNEYLKKHGLKAKIVDKTTYKIAEDGYDDMQLVDDPMLTVLVLLCAVGLSAKDLHYRAKGRSFYGLHELSDVVWQIEHASDDLNEVYYMGEKGDVPPDRAFVAAKASEQVGQAGGMDDILTRLTGLVDALAKAVETAKKPGVASGTAAVLDDISKKSLQAKGLLVRTQKDIEKSAANQAAIDKVVGRGIVIGGATQPAAGRDVACDAGTTTGGDSGGASSSGGRWITVHPNGAEEGKGRPIHINGNGKIDSSGPLSQALKNKQKYGQSQPTPDKPNIPHPANQATTGQKPQAAQQPQPQGQSGASSTVKPTLQYRPRDVWEVQREMRASYVNGDEYARAMKRMLAGEMPVSYGMLDHVQAAVGKDHPVYKALENQRSKELGVEKPSGGHPGMSRSVAMVRARDRLMNYGMTKFEAQLVVAKCNYNGDWQLLAKLVGSNHPAVSHIVNNFAPSPASHIWPVGQPLPTPYDGNSDDEATRSKQRHKEMGFEEY